MQAAGGIVDVRHGHARPIDLKYAIRHRIHRSDEPPHSAFIVFPGRDVEMHHRGALGMLGSEGRRHQQIPGISPGEFMDVFHGKLSGGSPQDRADAGRRPRRRERFHADHAIAGGQIVAAGAPAGGVEAVGGREFAPRLVDPYDVSVGVQQRRMGRQGLQDVDRQPGGVHRDRRGAGYRRGRRARAQGEVVAQNGAQSPLSACAGGSAAPPAVYPKRIILVLSGWAGRSGHRPGKTFKHDISAASRMRVTDVLR